MPKQEVLNLRPSGWETDPEEERFKVSVIDRTPTCTYNHYALFFRLEDGRKTAAVNVLRGGLERTLSQARYMCGTIERDVEGGYSFVKRRESTVRLVIQPLDSPDETHPSMDDIEKAHFAAHALGDLSLWGVPNMMWGEQLGADLDRSPTVAAYQLNLVRGGMVFSMHSHHCASDVMGWSNFTHQLADNCLAIASDTPPPPWDAACLDVSRFTRDLPEDALVDGPAVLPRHPGHPEQQAVLFHLPRSKAAQLKKLASPPPPPPPAATDCSTSAPWISTYDAMCAFVWRSLSRVRAPLHRPDPSSHLWWAEAVNMRPRLPGTPPRMLRNVLSGAFSDTAAGVAAPRPTAADVVSPSTPLSELAAYVRRLTESCTEAHLEALVAAFAPVRDKQSVSLRVDAHPPMSVFVTDHRSGDVSGFDFGFATPVTYRHLWGSQVTAGLVLIYAPIRSSSNPDEGCMFTITMEKELVPKLLQDPEWSQYFEYRGID